MLANLMAVGILLSVSKNNKKTNTSTYNYNFIDYNYPTCYDIANKLSNKYSIKTGTTDTDHLVFGYNKDIVVGIWSGYDDNRISETSDGKNIKYMWTDIVETYMKDFNDMNNIIEKYTGKRSKIFRFPGGSSNTVSRGYSTGVVKAIASKTSELGYVYFDWNVDSNDAGGASRDQIVEINKKS